MPEVKFIAQVSLSHSCTSIIREYVAVETKYGDVHVATEGVSCILVAYVLHNSFARYDISKSCTDVCRMPLPHPLFDLRSNNFCRKLTATVAYD